MPTQNLLDDVKICLDRVQQFDPRTIARKSDLGKLDFTDAIPDARRIVDLFQRINKEKLDIFSDNYLNIIKNNADSAFNILNAVLVFDPSISGNAAEERRSLFTQLKSMPEAFSDALALPISFSVASSLDPTTTQQEMRAIIQSFSDQKDSEFTKVEDLKAKVEAILSDVRDAAAEQGVSQQATYFKALADKHDAQSAEWLKYSLIIGISTLVFAFASALTYKIAWLAPNNNIETAQLITGKLLIMSILGYALLASVRVFLSNNHNGVVNRHRQNALLTYTAFVNAAPSDVAREVILTHAAASVFSPQETGYIRHEEPAAGKSIMEIMTKSTLGDRSNA